MPYTEFHNPPCCPPHHSDCKDQQTMQFCYPHPPQGSPLYCACTHGYLEAMDLELEKAIPPLRYLLEKSDQEVERLRTEWDASPPKSGDVLWYAHYHKSPGCDRGDPRDPSSSYLNLYCQFREVRPVCTPVKTGDKIDDLVLEVPEGGPWFLCIHVYPTLDFPVMKDICGSMMKFLDRAEIILAVERIKILELASRQLPADARAILDIGPQVEAHAMETAPPDLNDSERKVQEVLKSGSGAAQLICDSDQALEALRQSDPPDHEKCLRQLHRRLYKMHHHKRLSSDKLFRTATDPEHHG